MYDTISMAAEAGEERGINTQQASSDMFFLVLCHWWPQVRLSANGADHFSLAG